MSREEAIEWLNKLYMRTDITDEYGDMEDMQPYEEAVNMAIQALEQQPSEDCISREAVLDFIDKMPSELTADGRRMIRRRTLEEYISDTLPSVTPQPKMGHWIDDEFGSKCSCCDIYTHLDKFDRPMKFKCCSMCGAKMVEPQESEELNGKNEF